MDSCEFVVKTKQYAVDDTVNQIFKTLTTPRPAKRLHGSGSPVEQDISQWINDHSLLEQRRSEWFNRLKEDDQVMIRDFLEDCAELAVASFFTFLDGVGESYEEIFEIVAIGSDNQRNVLNPQNTEMMHDIFYEVCEEGRRRG
jgi:hypothetical protein